MRRRVPGRVQAATPARGNGPRVRGRIPHRAHGGRRADGCERVQPGRVAAKFVGWRAKDGRNHRRDPRLRVRAGRAAGIPAAARGPGWAPVSSRARQGPARARRVHCAHHHREGHYEDCGEPARAGVAARPVQQGLTTRTCGGFPCVSIRRRAARMPDRMSEKLRALMRDAPQAGRRGGGRRRGATYPRYFSQTGPSAARCAAKIVSSAGMASAIS